ncbi:hypothetical protein [Paenarthrobacter nicotinovorans]|uniref:hypothetical protein n=1 Tax=Paenarthrobacter nicotinovorans TaxID=29320 RepID=UPI0004B4D474|nr:hypothetical protein [Paenarthrobacter nicotinovorans]
MAGVPEQTSGSGPGRNEPEYELIGGVIDDQPSSRSGPKGDPGPPGTPGPFNVAVREAWRNTRKSFASWWFWLACVLGIALAWGAALAVVALGQSNGWFEVRIGSAVHLIMAVFLAMAAAILGTLWGFRHSQGSILVLALSGAMRGVALAFLACAAVLVVGLTVGGPIALAGAAVVVIVLEVVLFGLIGSGARGCFAAVGPGAALAVVVVAFLCAGNVVLTILLLPGTTVIDQASVPVNVERDDSGRINAYECVGDLRPVEVAHTERVAWLAASNPGLLLGSVAADMVPADNELGWVLSGLQWTADGPSRDVPCLGGESSEGLAPTVPVAITGLMLQALVAAAVLVPARRRRARKARTAEASVL